MPDYNKLKDLLRGPLDEKRREAEESRTVKNDEDRTRILEGIGKDVAETLGASLAPVIMELARNSKLSAEDIKEAFKGATISIPPIEFPKPVVNVNVPEVKVPPIKIPPIKVTVPDIKVPEQRVIFPSAFKIDHDRMSPVPVILTTGKGEPYSISQFGASGGKPLKQYQEADTASLLQGLAMLGEAAGDTLLPLQLGTGVADRALRVVHATDVAFSASFAAGTLVQTLQLSGATDSVYVTGAADSTFAVILNPDGRVKVELPTGVTGLTDIELRAAHLDVQQVSGSVDSINVLQVSGTAVAAGEGVVGAGTLRVVQAVDSASSVRAIANSGVDIGDVDVLTLPAITITAGEEVDVSPNQAGDALTAETLRVLHVTDAAVSVRAISNTGVDIGDVDVLSIAAGDNNIGNVDVVTAPTIEVKQVSGAVHSAQVQGLARQTNPTAVANAAAVISSFDDLGRQVMTPYQVRDLVITAYVALANGTETALLEGAASTLHDLVHVICANTSDATVDLDFRSGTVGSVVFSLTVPADATAGFVPAVPLPQTEAAQAWTVDMADVTGTTVNISALFIKNV